MVLGLKHIWKQRAQSALESLYNKDSVYTLDLSLWAFSMCYDELSSFSEHFHR